jgi:hypothetical protein
MLRSRTYPLLLAVVAALALLAAPAHAADRDFTQRFGATDTGDVAIVGNTSLTCPLTALTCAAARLGTTSGIQAQNGGYSMVRVDVDGDSSTTTSSSATVSLPSGATVLWAGLYWGGRSSAADATRRAAKLKVPGASTYTDLTAEAFDTTTVDTQVYQGFANVTTAVRTAGSGTYWVGDVSVNTGAGEYGGWGLVVAYRDSAAPRHHLIVFDGLKQLNTSTAPTTTVTATGLMTPASGTVKADLGLIAYDGDRGLVSDGFKVNGTSVSDGLNPVNNVLNSTIGRRGTRLTAKNPDYVDQLGFEADVISIDGALTPGASTATLEFSAGAETYMPGMLSFVTDVETVPPVTTIGSGPSGATNDTTPAFTFTSNEAGSTFECRVDGGAWASCTSPHTTATLGEGSHTFQVRATDPAGNLETTPASRTFTVDTTPPGTTITSGPSGPTNDPTATFEFTADESGSTFECRVDGGAWGSCVSPLTTPALADGAHSFEVRAIDPAGNVDASPASRSFTVDTAAPQTTITSGPSGSTEDNTPTFEFAADQAGSRFECRVDGGAWASCTSPVTLATLSDGEHTFEARAIDAAGNTDPSAASLTFTVVGRASSGSAGTTQEPPAQPAQPAPSRGPTVSITSAPKDDDPVPVYTFTADQPDASFLCKIDGGAAVPCPSPYALPANLAEGDHVLEIVGISARGVRGAPVRVGFTVGAGCAGTNGFRSAGVRGNSRGLAIEFVRRVQAPVRADIFQVSIGRTVLRERLIARYRVLTRSVTWPGKRDARGRRIADGVYFVRLSIPLGPGRGSDIRRLVAQRSGGRWIRRADYYGRPICGLVTSYKLERAVFGGANRRTESMTFRLARPAKVTVDVVRGGRVVKRLGGRTYPAKRTVRLRLPNAGLRRGVYSFRLKAQGGGRKATATAGARML